MISSLAEKSSLRSLAAFMAFSLLFFNTPLPARGQDADDIEQTVARISYVQGAVSYGRGDDPDNWDPAIVNVPFTSGDRIYSSGEGRAELQLPAGEFIRLGRGSYLSALTLTYDTRQFYLGNGAATINIRQLGPDEVFEIDTPNMAVTFEAPGRYRVEVDDDGNTRVIVRRGTAVVAANGRQVTVEQAEMRVYGTDSPRYEIIGLRAPDAFDRWVDEREDRFERSYASAYQYADEGIVGVEELAQYGRWEDIPEYGSAWTPTQVPVGWQPFTVGHFFWQDPWGWGWISEEPWGWAPCHYGSWTFYRSRWYWVPIRRRVEVVRYAPAVIEFVTFRDHVGWFPLHPRDRFVPWWGGRGRVEEVTFVNRSRVVVIDQETFITGRRVTTRIVRDTVIIREATTVRVFERPLPIPRRESIRVVERSESRQIQRPPANILARSVVVRTAPVPPPPRFDEKLRVIQERQGKPLSPAELHAMGAKDFKANQRIRIRPVAEGRNDFAPRTQGGSAPQPQPLTASRGRKLATPDQPVLTDLPRRQERRDKAPGQPEPSKEAVKPSEPQRQQERERQKDEKQLQEQQRKDQQSQDQQLKEQERQKKQQEQDRQKQEKQLQEQQRKDQQQRDEQQRQQQEQERQKKQQEQERQKQLQEQQRKDQQQLKEQQQRDEQQRRDQERQRQEQERQKKQQEQEKQKQDKQLEEQKSKDLERQKQLQEQQRKEQEQRKQQQQRDEQQRQEQERQQKQQEQERQKQLQEQQRKQQQIQQEQQRQEQERRRQEQEQQRLQKQQQEQQRKPQDEQSRELERQRKVEQEQARQKQLQEQQRLQKEKEQQRKEQGQGQDRRDDQPPPPPPPPK